MTEAAQRYLDDFRVGERFDAPPITLGAEHFRMFADMTGDDHPIHYDAEYARGLGLEAPIVHGLLLVATTAFGAAPAAHSVHEAMIAMLGTEARFRKPVFAGDTLRRSFEVAGVEPKDESRGILRLALSLHNQREELVLEGEHVIMLRRRRDGRPDRNRRSPP